MKDARYADADERALWHFLRLSAAQLRNKIKEVEEKQAYSPFANRLRMLEALIKEQTPNEDFGSSARQAR